MRVANADFADRISGETTPLRTRWSLIDPSASVKAAIAIEEDYALHEALNLLKGLVLLQTRSD